MSESTRGPAAGGPWEKAGNTSWVRCASCDSWFHVAEEMLDTEGARMHCPHCHNEFTAEKPAVWFAPDR